MTAWGILQFGELSFNAHDITVILSLNMTFCQGRRALQFFSGCFAYNSTCDGACLSEIVF